VIAIFSKKINIFVETLISRSLFSQMSGTSNSQDWPFSLRKPTSCLIISGINLMYLLLATILTDDSVLLIPHGKMQGNDPDKNNMHMPPM
jgi:hypothetical protein